MKRPLIAILGIVLIGSVATAQTAPAPATTLPDSRLPQIPPNNSAAEQAGQRLPQTRGSLLQATLSQTPDPAQARLDQVSFFAVRPPEPKVIRKHDLVTIIVREESESRHEGNTELSKEYAVNARVDEWIRLNLANLQVTGDGIGASPPAIRFNAEREYTGEGTAERFDSITARIQAEVVDVKPNGTLVLAARKTITTDDDQVRFVLSGICRVEDVTADNTVLSTQIFDLELSKTTRGGVTQTTRRGWVPKLLDFANIF